MTALGVYSLATTWKRIRSCRNSEEDEEESVNAFEKTETPRKKKNRARSKMSSPMHKQGAQKPKMSPIALGDGLVSFKAKCGSGGPAVPRETM
mmetsp:Transcript_95166/g.268926  ORF Transcript_95166/g.268926 Transcript_95166/m.268926 type:complete len:93 (-) Transcript_95166:277-555(-)|eukprot:CAMPEP_0117465892 /NCGR_PEP_ID=MMETSP0784-20121206/4860_1 /TAXON_ID=39447 /ORGANISM="" /LENGTH=92 /DNA_ID=CAMNT_0005259815 /DNA_START=642 /DNA_END=920 /DNA_ORIENTATION=+